MKRKWMWALAAFAVVAGFVFAKRLADKRPRLVMRGVNASALVVSPGEKRVLSRGSSFVATHVFSLKDGSYIYMPGDINSRQIFSPDGKKICES